MAIGDPRQLLILIAGLAITGEASAVLFSSMLPSSRSVEVGAAATAFATIINSASTPRTGCQIELVSDIDAGFTYQITDPATNTLIGAINTPVTIVNGGAQSFLVAITPNTVVTPVDVSFNYVCDDQVPAATWSGINTLLFSASATPVPDVVAIALTPSLDGIVNVPADGTFGFMALASVNVGASSMLTVSARASFQDFNGSIVVCETDPVSGTCLQTPASSVNLDIPSGATPTFAVFANSTDPIALDPANHRLIVEFTDVSGVVRGATSTAIVGGSSVLSLLIEAIRAEYGLPAAAVVIVQDGVLTNKVAVGLRSLDHPQQVNVNDKWHLGSITKAMTATMIATLVEDGLMTFDTSPRDVWPGSVNSFDPQFRDLPISQIMAQQSGLTNNIFAIPSLSEVLDSSPLSLPEKRFIWATELLAIAPVAPLGTYYYSNSSYIVAGAMAETIADSSWESLMQERLFEPLGMSSSAFGAPGTAGLIDQPLGHRTTAPGVYEPVPPGPGSDNQQALGPAGTIHTTLDAYAKYMIAHLEGELGMSAPGALLSPATFQFLHAPYLGLEYGQGWIGYVPGIVPGRAVTHNGSNTMWCARVDLHPSKNWGILVVTNAGIDEPCAAVNEMAGQVLQYLVDSE